ncbi:hypothetical protein AB5J62_23260 [Amycolatopsis sp. cg5]|uniref:hypothetical protein n=1 Tax=Amycolatopsis sp. cg5 TaxID=3238802 RepID=UPI003526568F
MDYDKYKTDIKRITKEAVMLEASFVVELRPEYEDQVREAFKIDKVPAFKTGYQSWYSESLVILQQLLPARVDDFVDYYKPRRTRKQIDAENYTVSDYLQGVQVTQVGRIVTGPESALPKFQQQVRIIQALENRFDSTLYDLTTVLQADLFDHEIDAAAELLKRGFYRAAGALAGVVLESHLGAVCQQHGVVMRKKSPTIADFNDSLKQADIINVATWRKIQYLGDLRNLCSHSKDKEPKVEEVDDLLGGVASIIKKLF